MGEYQYYEWQAADRVLTPQEQAAVRRLSSHIEVGPGRAVVTYNWSDFRHDPKRVLLNYFDAFFYLSEWGSLRLMFRFPAGQLAEADIDPYCIDESISFETVGMHQVLDLEFNPEDGGDWQEGDASLSDFIHLRGDLLEGDYRLLYLAWLAAMSMYGEPFRDEGDEDGPPFNREPPVPPGLKNISPSLQNFVQVFGIDPCLVKAAAEASPDLKQPLAVEIRRLVERLERDECNEFLTRLAQSDPSAGLALRKRLKEFLPQERLEPVPARTIDQLYRRAAQLEAAEKSRLARAARQKHIAEMKALAGREAQVWRQVEDLLENGPRIASVYDQATELLERLYQLAEFQDTRDSFLERLGQLAEKYAARPALMARWRERGWL